MMKNFENKIDKEILPLIKANLLIAYQEGYNQSIIDNYQNFINIHDPLGLVVDFGLPSETLWIVRMSNMAYRVAKKLGLKFPTKKQLEELLKCKWSYFHFDCMHCHILGPNGYEVGVFDSVHDQLCIWTTESVEDENFMVEGYVYSNNSNQIEKTLVYSGDKYSSLFVVPSF